MPKFKITEETRENKNGTIKFKTINIQSKYKNKMMDLNDVKKYYNQALTKYDKSQISIQAEDIVGAHTMKGFTTNERWNEEEDYWAERVNDPEKYEKFLWVSFIIKNI